MKTQILFFLLTTILLLLLTGLLLPEVLQAQAAPPDDVPQNPIDGGLALLAAAGGAYAVKKLKDRKE